MRPGIAQKTQPTLGFFIPNNFRGRHMLINFKEIVNK